MKLSTQDRIHIVNCITSRIAYLNMCIEDDCMNLNMYSNAAFKQERGALVQLLDEMNKTAWIFEQEGKEE